MQCKLQDQQETKYYNEYLKEILEEYHQLIVTLIRCDARALVKYHGNKIDNSQQKPDKGDDQDAH